MKIPYGTTWSYLKLARHQGNVKAIRAVATAKGKYPLGIVVPCHRVRGNQGALTGCADGLCRKQWLLNHEESAGSTGSFFKVAS